MAILHPCFCFSEGSITVCSNSVSLQQVKLTFYVGHQGIAILILKSVCLFTEEERIQGFSDWRLPGIVQLCAASL